MYRNLDDGRLVETMEELHDKLGEFIAMTGASYNYDTEEYELTNVKEHCVDSKTVELMTDFYEELGYILGR